MVEKDSMNITEAEAALYDRQIRLWGLDAQKRLRASDVLLIGVSGLGAEVAKNIVLSGIKSLTLLDHTQVSEADICSQFLASHDDVGKNRAESSLERTQQLNPMVQVSADPEDVATKPDDYFTKYSVICATCCQQEQLTRINDICHKENIMFFAGDVFGYYGYMFADLNDHEYADEVTKKAKPVSRPTADSDGEPATKKSKVEEDEKKTVKKMCSFKRLKSALSVDWTSEEMVKKLKRMPKTYFIWRVLLEFMNIHGRQPDPSTLVSDREELNKLRDSMLDKLHVSKDVIPEDFAKYCMAELSPVCAVTGGILGQEIIKAVSKKDQPHNNFFFYNGVDGSGMVDHIG